MPHVPVVKLEGRRAVDIALDRDAPPGLPAEDPPEPEDPVDRVIAQSFPASDPPAWWAGARPG